MPPPQDSYAGLYLLDYSIHNRFCNATKLKEGALTAPAGSKIARDAAVSLKDDLEWSNHQLRKLQALPPQEQLAQNLRTDMIKRVALNITEIREWIQQVRCQLTPEGEVVDTCQ